MNIVLWTIGFQLEFFNRKLIKMVFSINQIKDNLQFITLVQLGQNAPA